MVPEPSYNCTHLAAPKIARTKKFICALAHGPTIVNLDYIDQCLRRNEKLEPDDFLLKETPEESARGYKLSQSVERARLNKCRLLRNYVIYGTENVHGGFDTYKAIIEQNGGTCLMYRARATSTANASRAAVPDGEANGTMPSTPDYLYLVSSSKPEDAKIWPKFRKMAQEKGKIPRIVHTDWVLDLALRQEVQWHDKYELSEAQVKAVA